jgi:Fe-S oxidoreductase
MVHNCSGVGACRNVEKGTMCPSYRATKDEIDSTRGRANVLRLAMSGQLHFDDLAHPDVKQSLDLCLSCKACKTECPSNVDMAKLKAEVQQISFDKRGASLSEKLPKYASAISKIFAGLPSYIINPILNLGITKTINQKLLRISSNRNLPAYAHSTLNNWSRKNNNFISEKKVVLFADTYINYHEVELGIDAIKLLNKCGFEVIVADIGCCQRPRISNGFLKAAKAELEILSQRLLHYIDQGLNIITIEPSCTTALIDDLPDLIDDEKLGIKIKAHVFPAEKWLLEQVTNGNINGRLIMKTKKYIHHGHCHQKAIYTTLAVNQLLKLAGGIGLELETGCCGMAGAFGYEDRHYDVSVRIANQKLIPQLNKYPDDVIVANGYSCRHQIHDLTSKKAIHVMSVLDVEY